MEAENLNIAMLCVHSYPKGQLGTTDTGGMSVYICETARELGKRGHRVDIYTRSYGPGQEGVITMDENVRLIHIKAGEDRHLTRNSLYPHLEKFIEGMETFRRKTGLRYDLAHSHYWLSGCAGRWARDSWSVPHVINFHTVGAAENMFSPGPAEPELRLIREKELVENCDCVISPTEREKKEIIKFYDGDPSKIAVIDCGVNLDLFRPVNRKDALRRIGFQTEEKILLYVGRVDPMKGVDRLLAAAALLKGRVQFKLMIIGGDDPPRREQKRLQDMVQRLGIGESVIFAGSLPQEELPFYYSAADVFVLPSHYESFGMVGLESLACGTPVVATDVGVYPEILNGGLTGRLAPGGRPDSIAEKISEVLSWRKNGENLPREIRKAVNRFTWTNVAEALIAEYTRLIERKDVRSGGGSLSTASGLSGRAGTAY